MSIAKSLIAGLALAGTAALCGCADEPLHLGSDFGSAIRQDAAAQIANPDAKYAGDPAPGSLGRRVELSQTRYVEGKVVQPAVSQTSNAVGGGGGGGGGGGATGPQ